LIIDLSKFQSGFCDKLKKITFCLTVARFKKIKFIKIFDKPTKENPFLFYDLCKIKNFKIIRLYEISKDFIDPFNFNSFNLNFNYETCKNFKPNDIKISNHEFLSRWQESYKFIKPKNTIKIKIDKILKNKKINLGLHIRLTDKLVTIKNKLLELPYKDTVTKIEYNSYLNTLSNFIRNYNNNNHIFIASDSYSHKTEVINVVKKYYNKVLINSSKFNIKKFRQTNGKDFLIDLFLLSRCRVIYTTGGGVPVTAKLLSNKKISLKYISKNNVSVFLIYYFSKIIFFLRKCFLNKLFNFCKFYFFWKKR
jgi:hypothetical protein